MQDSIVPIEKITFLLDKQIVTPYDLGNNLLFLRKDSVSNNGTTLDVVVQIADSIAELKFQFKVFRLDDYRVKIQQEITPEGFLKIFWDKLPEFKNLEIEEYEITYKDQYSNYISKKLPSTATSIIDSTYVYGERYYSLKTYFAVKDTTISKDYIYSDHYVQYQEYTDDDFSLINIDGKRAKISWRKNEFNCKYYIQSFPEDIILKWDENSIEIDREFPEYGTLTLKLVPANQEVSKNNKYVYVFCNYHDNYLFRGDYPSYRTGHAVDLNNRIIYFNTKNGVFSYNADNMDLISSYQAERGHISVSKTDSRILLVNSTTFYIFKDATLKNPLVFEGYKTPSRGYTYAAIGGEYIVTYNRYDEKVHVYDSRTGKILFEFPVVNNNTNVVLSPDGKYLMLYEPSHEGYISIHALTKTSAGQIYSARNWWVEYCEFDPQDSNRLNFVMRYKRGYSVFDISKREVIETKTTDYGRIDPFTGNRVCNEKDDEGNGYHVIYNKSKSKILYKTRANFFSPIGELFNNHLFAGGGNSPSYYYYLNIKDYLAE